MDTRKLTKTIGRIGWVAGAGAFLIFGLLQGALVGGAIGIETGGYLFGPVASAGDIGPRMMAAAGMLAGVAITGAIFISCGLALGRLAGVLIGMAGDARGGADLVHTNRR